MRSCLQTAAAAALVLSPPAFADEAIRQSNNQEAFSIAIAPLHTTEQSNPPQGAPVIDSVAGNRYLYGYEVARTRTIFSMPGWYTDIEASLGSGTLRDAGYSFQQGPIGLVPMNEAVMYGEESVRVRLGRTFEFPGSGIFAVTPFAGLAQMAWIREAPVNDTVRALGYADDGAEAGILAQASLPWHLVAGASASAGRTLGTLIHGSTGERIFATTSSFSLKVDHRTIPDWHQSVEVRQTIRRFSLAPDVVSFFEPSRTSELAILFEVGWEIPGR